MCSDVEVVWRKGDAEMPENVKHVVMSAQEELLLRSLNLPVNILDTIRYNAGKSEKTIIEYISSLVLESVSITQ